MKKEAKKAIKKVIAIGHLIPKSMYGVAKALCRGKRAKFTPMSNDDVIIMGNGPSLNDIDLQAISESGIELACVNFFPSRNAYFAALKPKYLILLDPDFFADFDQLPKAELELYQILQKVDWQMYVVIPQGAKIPINNPNLIVEKLCVSTLYSEHLTHYLDWLYKHNLLTIGFQNVVIGAGFYFISSGVKKLYYAGIDMSEFKQLFVDEQNRVYVDAIHNYGSERHYSTLFNRGEFHKLLRLYQMMFEQFHYLSKYAERQGVEVINLSENSYVDVFTKSTLFHKES